MARRTAAESDIREVLLETYAANDRMNQLLFESSAGKGGLRDLPVGPALEKAWFRLQPQIMAAPTP
jgi:hypothetical protein